MIVVTAADMRDVTMDVAVVGTVDATGVVTVTTAEAAWLAGVTPRTIRRWLQEGWLASVEEDGERRISPADLPVAKELARQRAQEGRRRGHSRAAARVGGVTTADATADATRDMTRDTTAGPLMVARGALAPLLERLGVLEREGGELRGRLATTAAVVAAKDETIAELRRRAEVAERELARLKGVHGSSAAPGEAGEVARAGGGTETCAPWWRRLWHTFAGVGEG